MGLNKQEIIRQPSPNIILTTTDLLFGWARSSSLFQFLFGLACCAIEMMATSASDFDTMRFGVIPRATPRHADLMIVAGTVTKKMAPVVKKLYDQMPDPKYVIAMGNCAISGGAFYYDNYAVVKGVEEIIPVDVYVPGCPPRPEALIHGILKLREKIRSGSKERA